VHAAGDAVRVGGASVVQVHGARLLLVKKPCWLCLLTLAAGQLKIRVSWCTVMVHQKGIRCCMLCCIPVAYLWLVAVALLPVQDAIAMWCTGSTADTDPASAPHSLLMLACANCRERKGRGTEASDTNTPLLVNARCKRSQVMALHLSWLWLSMLGEIFQAPNPDLASQLLAHVDRSTACAGWPGVNGTHYGAILAICGAAVLVVSQVPLAHVLLNCVGLTSNGPRAYHPPPCSGQQYSRMLAERLPLLATAASHALPCFAGTLCDVALDTHSLWLAARSSIAQFWRNAEAGGQTSMS
jgi:hypothetical protein